MGHCNRWGLWAVPFCSSDEGAHGSDSNFEDRDRVIEGRPAERETSSEARDTGDSWCIGPDPGGIGGESGGDWHVEEGEERDGVMIHARHTCELWNSTSDRQSQYTWRGSSGCRFTLIFPFLFWQQNLTNCSPGTARAIRTFILLCYSLKNKSRWIISSKCFKFFIIQTWKHLLYSTVFLHQHSLIKYSKYSFTMPMFI